MQLITQETFTEPGLPEGWYTDTAYPRYLPGRWDCRTSDGAFMPLPHDSWRALRVEIDVVECGLQSMAFCGPDAHSLLSLALDDCASLLVFEWDAEKMWATVNGTTVTEVENVWRSARTGTLQLGFRDCEVQRIAVFGAALEEVAPTPVAIDETFPLEVTMDFNDDLMACAWTQHTFDNLVLELKSWGTRRIVWIDLGTPEEDYFSNAPLSIGRHGNETVRNVGDPFATVVRGAHALGMEVYGLLKPFDMAIAGFTWPPASPQALEHGRISRIGGATGWATRLAQHNQHLVMARKPSAFGEARNAVWTRLDLVKDDELATELTAADFSLYISGDNEHFQLYEGPASFSEGIEDYPLYQLTPSGPRRTGTTRPARVLRFDDLEIEAPFLALEVRSAAGGFANSLCNLVHLYGPAGEETHLTYAVSPRSQGMAARYEASAPTELAVPAAPLQGGFEFNRYPGTPTANMGCGGDALKTQWVLDQGAPSYLAFARGKDRGPLAVLSPSYPETRRLWLTWIERMLDRGADGIDIRPGHHHSDFAWIEYGFEEPVRKEMLRRTGVDIWETNDFDYTLWRTIRGEGWTQFLREASALVRARGKKMVLHIESFYEAAPGHGGAMNLLVDWRSWLTEKLCDQVTGKALWPLSTFAREVLDLAHSNGITVSYTPYCNNFFEDRSSPNHLGDSPAGCEIPVGRLIQFGKEGGFDAFGFYECAAALRASADGSVQFRPGADGLRAVLQSYFGGSAPEGMPS